MFTIKGKVKVVGQLEKISKSFQKRSLVIVTDDKFPQTPQFEFTHDRVTKLDGLKVGQEIEIDFFLKGREWTSPKDGEVKYFNSLEGWEVRSGITEAVKKIDEKFAPEDDDLPF